MTESLHGLLTDLARRADRLRDTLDGATLPPLVLARAIVDLADLLAALNRVASAVEACVTAK